jgi:hypothetical protein
VAATDFAAAVFGFVGVGGVLFLLLYTLVRRETDDTTRMTCEEVRERVSRERLSREHDE